MNTTLRYCVICQAETRWRADGCQTCKFWDLLRERIAVSQLSREYVLANTNDGTDYETPVLEQERTG